MTDRAAKLDLDLAVARRPADEPPTLQRIGELVQARRASANWKPGDPFDALHALYRVIEVLSQSGDRADLLNRVNDVVRDALQADHASICLVKGSLSDQMETEEVFGDATLSRTIVGDAIEKRMGLVVFAVAEESEYAKAESVETHRPGTVLCAPLFRGESPLMVVYAARRPGACPFDGKDLDLAFAVAQQLAVALHRLEAQEELVRLATMLYGRERLATVGQLSAGVLHEVRNLIGASSGFLDVAQMAHESVNAALARDHKDEAIQLLAELSEDLAGARASLVQLQSICGSMMDLVRRRTPEMHPVEMRSLIQSAARLAVPEVRERHATLVVDPGPTNYVMGDEGALTQVFLNLIVNAAQAASADGSDGVHIQLRAQRLPDGEALIQIDDDGAGIPEELHERIFEPLFTTREKQGGTGLGLAISRDLVHSSGGSITVSSIPGQGTRFEIRLKTALAR